MSYIYIYIHVYIDISMYVYMSIIYIYIYIFVEFRRGLLVVRRPRLFVQAWIRTGKF